MLIANTKCANTFDLLVVSVILKLQLFNFLLKYRLIRLN